MANVRPGAEVRDAAQAALADDGWHAQFSPSSSERWITCPGSIAATRGCSSTSSSFADEGTAAHTVAARALTYKKPAAFFVGEQIEVNHNVWTVTEEMAGYVQEYLDDCYARVGEGTMMFEQRVWFSETIGVEDQGGTSDFMVLSGDCCSLLIKDLKYGLGVRVDAEENTQMMTYALGVLETYSAVMEDVQEVTLVIHQPRLDHLSEWKCSIERLRQHAATIRQAASDAIRGIVELDIRGAIPPELFRPTEDACRWCPIKATCEHLRAKVSALVFNDFRALENPAVAVTNGAPPIPAGNILGELSAAFDLIEDWVRAGRAELERMVLAGMEVIGPDGQPMKLIEGRKGYRAWVDQEAAKAALAAFLPPEKYYKPQPIVSPAEAEKLMKKQAGKQTWAERFVPLIKQPPGKPKVALGSDPAPKYVPAAGACEFDNLGGEE